MPAKPVCTDDSEGENDPVPSPDQKNGDREPVQKKCEGIQKQKQNSGTNCQVTEVQLLGHVLAWNGRKSKLEFVYPNHKNGSFYDPNTGKVWYPNG